MSTDAILITPDPQAPNGHRVETIDLDQHGTSHHHAIQLRLQTVEMAVHDIADGLFLWTGYHHDHPRPNHAARQLTEDSRRCPAAPARGPAVITAITFQGHPVGLTPGQTKRWSIRARKAAAAANAHAIAHEKGRNR